MTPVLLLLFEGLFGRDGLKEVDELLLNRGRDFDLKLLPEAPPNLLSLLNRDLETKLTSASSSEKAAVNWGVSCCCSC